MSAERIKELEDELAALRASDPVATPRKRRKAKPIDVLAHDEVLAILAEAPTDVEGRRFAAMTVLLYVSGLRIGEAVSLRHDSIEPLGNGVAVVHVPDADGCKTGYRDVPVVLERLEPYFTEYLAIRDESPALFSTRTGSAVHPNSYNRALKHYAEKAGVTSRVHAHCLRHSFAVNWIRGGGDLASLKSLLGHRDAAMSLRYADHVGVDALIETVRSRG